LLSRVNFSDILPLGGDHYHNTLTGTLLKRNQDGLASIQSNYWWNVLRKFHDALEAVVEVTVVSFFEADLCVGLLAACIRGPGLFRAPPKSRGGFYIQFTVTGDTHLPNHSGEIQIAMAPFAF
jgi:hypothetical protein